MVLFYDFNRNKNSIKKKKKCTKLRSHVFLQPPLSGANKLEHHPPKKYLLEQVQALNEPPYNITNPLLFSTSNQPTQSFKMPPKVQRVALQPAKRTPKGYFASTYSTLTSPENASVVRSVAVFGVALAFFSSSWSEFLLPP
jgi:hypothetical protein